MKILEKLNISSTKPFICSIASNYGVGKTTLAAIIAANLVNERKRVLYITEDAPKYMLRKMKNLVTNETPVFRVIQNTNKNKEIAELFRGTFDYIILDTPSFVNEDIVIELQELMHKENVGIFLLTQLNKTFENKSKLADINPSRISRVSDYIIIMSKKGVDTLFKRLLRLLWIKLPNIKLDLIKNRIGDEKTVNIYVDFDKINKQ